MGREIMTDTAKQNGKPLTPAGVKTTLAGGAAIYLLLKAGSGYGWMLRPPGAVAEEEFLKKCQPQIWVCSGAFILTLYRY